jgi:hypothetical protein
MDIKRKTCDIRTWKKNTVFLNISSTILDTLVPPLYQNLESNRIEDPSSRQRGLYVRIMTARVQLQKESLVVSLKGLDAKTK